MTKVTLPPQNGAEAGEEVSFTYDGEDQMVKIDYPYMSIDLKQMNGDIIRRVAKVRFNKQETTVEKEISSYDVIVNGQLLCKYGNTPDTATTSRNDGKNTGEPQFYHYDHNNNLALTTDQHGNILEKTPDGRLRQRPATTRFKQPKRSQNPILKPPHRRSRRLLPA